jgi:OmpA-OmpF porin, OOP family
MKGILATACVVTAGLLASGCATKKYVRNTAAPIQAKVDQVGDQTARNGQSIEETRTQVKQVDERAQSGINAATERASTADQHALAADQHAADATNRANTAQQGVDQTKRDLAGLRQVISNLDDYKLQKSVSVAFAFDKYKLSDEAKQDLDQVADSVKSDRSFFIAVEGYTDQVGTAQYNLELSRHRADAVVQYLVAQRDIPIYRIQMIGLGEQKLVDEGKTKDARAKNRRVEVKVYDADEARQSLASGSGNATADRSQQQ